MEIARLIQGKMASEAMELLRFIPRKSAKLLFKVLKSAVSNAENNDNVSENELFVEKAITGQGPAFKRFRPASRGSAHPFKKHTSHVTITLRKKGD